MPCFADINVSQGSVATCVRCGGIFNIRLTANLPRNLPVNFFLKRLRFDRIMGMSPWPHFFGPPCIQLPAGTFGTKLAATWTTLWLMRRIFIYFFNSTVASQREPCTLYVAYTASRFTTTHNETPRERESPDIETLLEHSNSSEKKVLIRFYSIRQFYKFAACTLIFK